jgi:hypothetical protein
VHDEFSPSHLHDLSVSRRLSQLPFSVIFHAPKVNDMRRTIIMCCLTPKKESDDPSPAKLQTDPARRVGLVGLNNDYQHRLGAQNDLTITFQAPALAWSLG